MDSIETTTLNKVIVQQNGIIRNEKGYLIGRLANEIDYEGEHVKGSNKTTGNNFEIGKRNYTKDNVELPVNNEDEFVYLVQFFIRKDDKIGMMVNERIYQNEEIFKLTMGVLKEWFESQIPNMEKTMESYKNFSKKG